MGQGNWQGYGYAQPPQRPKKDNTVMWVLIVAGGIVAVLFLVALVITSTPSAKAHQAAEAASASAAVAAAEASAKAKAAADDVALHKACKVPPSKALQSIEPSDMKIQCRDIVRDRLKAPSTADFPGIFDADSKPTSADGCVMVYASYVDAQNSFGAKLRTKYVCTYDPRTGMLNVQVL